jgi:glycerol-3-phosphate dehydrogenase
MNTQVLIIGGGATGTGLARDLALRGIDCVLVEARDLNAGASGANHGLLHSGARYVSRDAQSARECAEESRLIKELAPHVVEDTGGLFVAVEGDDEEYVQGFADLCAESGITAEPLDVAQAREREPCLSPGTVAAFAVPDATIDPFRLGLENITEAVGRGAKFMRRTRVTGLAVENGRLRRAVCQNTRSGETFEVEAQVYVNACGAWAADVARLAGCRIPMIYSKGTLLVTHDRISRRVINRLRPPSDADILAPGGTVSILGTTSVEIDDLDDITPTVREVDEIIAEGARMIPELEHARYIRAYAGVRPLVQAGDGDGEDGSRGVSRDFTLIRHAEEGADNFITITGGKLTTFRLMAERTADAISEYLGEGGPCLTRTTPYPCTQTWKWTEPGVADTDPVDKPRPDDVFLCECEMVPRKAVDAILEQFSEKGGKPGLKALSRRSRLGKGSCQGTFCSLRTTAHLYDRGRLQGDQGVDNISDFLSERWRGQRSILWDSPLIQAELQEALYCGWLGMELDGETSGGRDG